MNPFLLWLSATLVAFPAPVTPVPSEPGLPEGAILQFGRVPYCNGSRIHASAMSRDGNLLATVGSRSVTVWDTTNGMPMQRFFITGSERFDGYAQVLAFSPDSCQLACKYNSQLVVIWDLPRVKEIRRFTADKHTFRSAFLKFSPDGKILIVPYHGRTRWMEIETGNAIHELEDTWLDDLSSDGNQFLSVSEKENRGIIGKTATAAIERTFTLALGEIGRWENWLLLPDGKTLAVVHRDIEENDIYRSQVQFWDTTNDNRPPRIWPLPKSDRKEHFHLTLSHDGKVVFFTEDRNYIRRYLWETGKELPSFDLYGQWTLALYPHPDGKTLFSVHLEEIRRWDLTTDKEILTNKVFADWGETAISPDGRYVAITRGSFALELWDTSQGKKLKQRVFDLENNGRTLKFAPDGRSLAINRYSRVEFLSVPELAKIGELTPEKASQEVKTQFGAGRYFATLDDIGWLRVFDHNTNKQIWMTKEIARMLVTPDGQALVAVSRDRTHRTVSMYVLADGKLRYEVETPNDRGGRRRGTGATVAVMAFTADGRTLALAMSGGQVCFLDAGSGKEIARFHSVPTDTTREEDNEFDTYHHSIAIKFSPDGRWLASGDTQGFVHIWEVSTRKELHRLHGQDALTDLAFTANGRKLVTIGGGEGFVWDLRPKPSNQNAGDPFKSLLSDDGPTAYRAQWALIGDPNAPAFLQARLPPQRVDVRPERIAALIAKLDSDRFAEREAASRALAELEGSARPALTAALSKQPSPEAARSMQLLLAHSEWGSTPAQLRIERAVQAMEMSGSDAARRVLRQWADGTPGLRLTDRARAALGRLVEHKP